MMQSSKRLAKSLFASFYFSRQRLGTQTPHKRIDKRLITNSSYDIANNTTRNRMNVIPIEALSDNYMYLIVDEASKECAAVDPVEPAKILQRVAELNLKLTKVLTTHHHWDHADGNTELVKLCGDSALPVYGADDRIPALTHKLKHDDQLQIGSSLSVRCLFTPCHTTGHMCYLVSNNANSAQPASVFTGDTLFIAGCGRFFEGSAEQMHQALIGTLATLADNTLVYCGHEYTVANLKYALHVEPDNAAARSKLEWAEGERSANRPTIPSTIGAEKQHNPFMRVANVAVMHRYGVTEPVECMRAMRREKDTWKPTASPL